MVIAAARKRLRPRSRPACDPPEPLSRQRAALDAAFRVRGLGRAAETCASSAGLPRDPLEPLAAVEPLAAFEPLAPFEARDPFEAREPFDAGEPFVAREPFVGRVRLTVGFTAGAAPAAAATATGTAFGRRLPSPMRETKSSTRSGSNWMPAWRWSSPIASLWDIGPE